jgi:hypothetical protein
MITLKKTWKKLKFYVQHADGVWSVPLLFYIFWLLGELLQYLGGRGVGTYDPGFFQPLILASAVVTGAINVAIFLIWINFRGLYRYLFGQKVDEKGEDGKKTGRRIFVNYSKIDWLKLTVWQRFLIAFGVFLLFASAVIIVYLHLV